MRATRDVIGAVPSAAWCLVAGPRSPEGALPYEASTAKGAAARKRMSGLDRVCLESIRTNRRLTLVPLERPAAAGWELTGMRRATGNHCARWITAAVSAMTLVWLAADTQAAPSAAEVNHLCPSMT